MNFFISNPRLVILVSLAFVVMGTRGLLNLQRESIPPVDFARAIISTVYPGSSSAEVEELITSKIENEIRSVNHLKDVHSTSQSGLSLINIRIDIDKTDTEKVINELHQSLQNVQGLPPEVLDPPRLTHIDTNKNKNVMSLYVSGPDKRRQRDEISFNLKTRLEKLSGISEVQINNYRKREFLVLLSQEKMDQLYVSSADVILALEQKKMDVPAGHMESPKKQNLVRVIGKIRTVEDLENTIVRSNFSGQKILIKDIALVMDSHEKEIQKEYFYHEGQVKGQKLKPSTLLSITKTIKADTLNLIAGIQNTVQNFKRNFGKEYEILTGFDESQNIKRRLSAVINNALTGLFLIVVVFFLFLPSRMGLMVSFSLPLSILGSFAILPFMGVSFNVITMLAFVICIGMLVDNSVVIAEYYSRLITEEKKSPLEAAQQSVRQFAKPITATVLTTIVAFLPMLVTTGVMGEFVKWIPIVVTLALLVSLFESFFLLPNRLQWLSQKKPSPYQTFFLNKLYRLESYFEKGVQKITAKKYISLSLIALLVLLTALLFHYGSRVDLFAARSPEFYTANLEPQANSSLSIVDREAKRIANKMQAVFGGEKTIKWMSVSLNTEQANVLLRVKASVLKQLQYKNILTELRKTEKGNLKTLSFDILKGGPPVGRALRAAIQSNDRRKIRQFIKEITPEIAKIPGIINLKSDPDTDRGKEYKVQVQPNTLARLGLGFQSVGRTLRTALEGQIITELTENNESFYIRVKYNPRQITSLEDLKQIKIRERMGRLIPLSEVAKIEEMPSEPDRKSYNFAPVVFLEAGINDKQTTSLKVNREAKKIIEEKIKKYPSLTFKMIGEQETTDESLRSLFNAAILAVFAIFVILIILFKSFLLSFLILTCIPLGLIGVVWAFFLHQRPLSFFAMIGVVGLAGVVVNSAIILVSFILKLKKDQPDRPLSEIVVHASRIRFRPILITNLTTLGGLLPTAYGLAGFEPLLMPMTLALFWGLFTATFLTLVWIPCAMLMIEDGKKLLSKQFSGLLK